MPLLRGDADLAAPAAPGASGPSGPSGRSGPSTYPVVGTRARLTVATRVALADPRTLGLVGSFLIALGSVGVGIVPKPDPISHLPLISLLRTNVAGQALSTSAILAGVAMMLTAWLAIGRRLRAGRGAGSGTADGTGVGITLGTLDVAGLRRTLLLWSAPLVLAPPLFSRDAYSYAAQGNMVGHGYDPYVVGPWVIPGPFSDSVDPMWATTPAPYGPLFLAVAGGISRVAGDSVYLGVLGMRLLALVGVWLLLVYVPRLAVSCRVDPAAALWLGVVNPLTVMHFVSGAHNDALMIGLVVAGLALALEGNALLGSAVVALAAGVKAPAALALPFVGLVWARGLVGLSGFSARMRRIAGYSLAGGTGLAVFAALTAVTGVGYGWIGALDTPGSVRTWLSPPTALGMVAGGLMRLLGSGEDVTWAAVDQVRAASGLLAVGLIAWLLLRARPIDPVRGCALALLLVVLLGPVVQPWYLMWALIPLAAGGVRAREGGLVAWGVVLTVVLSQVNGATMNGPFAIPGTLACLAVTAVVVRRARHAEASLFGADAVFDLAALRPGPSATPLRPGARPSAVALAPAPEPAGAAPTALA